jgi:hypothetical protein
MADTLYVPQRILSGDRNLARTATLNPSSVQSIALNRRSIAEPRTGTAGLSVSGTYTGEEEALYEVKIVDTTATSPTTSQPVFAGEGSGTLSGLAAEAGAVPQQITVKMVSEGIPLLYAKLEIEGELVAARAGGTGGNDLELMVDISGLVYTDTSFSLLNDLSSGAGSEDNPMLGPQYNWDTASLGADNIVPAGAKRIAFGDDPTVYVQYKKWEDNKDKYFLVPELQRDVKAGEIIKEVTGSRTVTLSNGVDPDEVFTNIVTLYDLLSAIDTTSVLAKVEGLVVDDQTPQGMATRDLQTRTDAHSQQSTGSGTEWATGVSDVVIGVAAPTELVKIKCFAATGADYPFAHLGHEYWKVTGSVSGEMVDNAVTGVEYEHPDGRWKFTIPVKLPVGYEEVPKGKFTLTSIDWVTREEADPDTPPVCFRGDLGPNARDGQVVLEYVKRPDGDCACADMPFSNLKTSCLGVLGEGGSVTYQTDTLNRLKALYEWYADTVKDNSKYTGGGQGREEQFLTTASLGDRSLKNVVELFEPVAALLDVVGTPVLRSAAFAKWDEAVAELQADVTTIEDGEGEEEFFGAFEVTAEGAIAAGDAVVLWNDGPRGVVMAKKATIAYEQSTGWYYGWCNAAITDGATGTAQRILGGMVTGLTGLTAGSNYWPDRTTPGTWTATALSAIGSAGSLTTGERPLQGVAVSATEIKITTIAGTHVSSLWVDPTVGNTTGMLRERYRSRLSSALIAGGLSPLGKSDTSIATSGDGCWVDHGGTYFWAVSGPSGGYAPAFTNQPYWSSRQADEDGKYYTTKEFAFQINIAESCVSRLREGDKIFLQIGTSGYPKTYQTGDELVLPVIAAGALPFRGGQASSLVQTWNVDSDVEGPLAQYSFDPDTPVAYNTAIVDFLLVEGGVPFRLGDAFVFNIEGGHWQWRKNSGAWSADIAISSTPTSMDAGLLIAFTPGAAPSYVDDDLWKFKAMQPYAASNIQTPSATRWKWDGIDADVVLDFGSNETMDCAAIAMHSIPAGATITVEGGTSPGVYTWSYTMIRREGAFFKMFTQVETARYVRLTIEDSEDDDLGWFFIGLALKPTTAAEVLVKAQWRVERSNIGMMQGGRFLGKTVSAEVKWEPGTLEEDTAEELLAVFDHCRENDDEPMLLIPQFERPDCILGRLAEDSVDFTDELGYHPDDSAARLLSTSFTLQGQWQAA